ncbi:MAG: GAF domain-containing protein [Pseudomonadota bacterium]
MRNASRELDQIRFLLRSLQIRPALQALNVMTDYRFTAVYRFTGSGASNLVIYDRLSDPPEVLLTVPEGASYCGIVRDTRDAFLVNRSLEDGRVFDHPARESVQSYCGVPLVGEDGTVFGSLCHFDFEPHDTADDLIELMQGVARYLDPASGLGELAEMIAQRVDRLAMMGDAIADASPGADELRETFDVYAQPILLQAQALSPGVREAMETRIEALLQALIERRAGRDAVQH